jgi:dipeptidyl aminopeptidase/acylaminoacyl peptidase
MNRVLLSVVMVAGVTMASSASGADAQSIEPLDVFQLEYASDPQISPDGKQVVYVRNAMDIMSDRGRSALWIVASDGSAHRALSMGSANESSPRFSPDGTKLLYVASEDGSTQILLRWLDSGQTTRLTQLTESPRSLVWSPDGKWIAFSMHVPEPAKPFVKSPPRPRGAEWAEPARVIRKLNYRADGRGYLEDGYRQLFVLPVDGGTPRQVTSGPFQHNGTPVWTPDGKSLIFSANRHEEGEYEPRNTDLYRATIEDGTIVALTDRFGPDRSPTISPDGKQIAYLGYDDRIQGYQVTKLYLSDVDGSSPRSVTDDLDRSAGQPIWAADGSGIYFSYSDHGNTKIGFVSSDGKVTTLAADVGGTSLGRPYSSGSFSVAADGRFAYTLSRPDHPADVAVGQAGSAEVRRLTHLNDDLLGHKRLAEVEEIWVDSSFDDRPIQAWIALPPGFDSKKKYPLILEIHGGPFANYGDRFAVEIQLYVAAGYVVVYSNPRGSTSYGEEFGNLIHHNYPGEDYDDLMSVVDGVIARGYVDTENLFVTGGSGGGVLSAWIVGKTDRFRAAVVAKPVINWYSFALTADMYSTFYKYWFPGFPWDHTEQYMRRSPISLVGNVTTPTMLLTGEADHRTPIAESEQYYQALKLKKVDTVMVRIPGASHGIARRPSNLISKVAHVLEWFEQHRSVEGEAR